MNNRMTLELPSLSANGPFARDTVAAFCAQLDPSLDELSDVKTAVSEAVTNCIVHAYPDAPGMVRIECAAERSALHIRIIDYGRGIADVARALEPFYTTLESEERSGMGFTIMQAFMSELSVYSEPGKGTTVSMRKEFQHGGRARGEGRAQENGPALREEGGVPPNSPAREEERAADGCAARAAARPERAEGADAGASPEHEKAPDCGKVREKAPDDGKMREMAPDGGKTREMAPNGEKMRGAGAKVADAR